MSAQQNLHFTERFKKGIAVGHSDIRSDSVHFEWWDGKRGSAWERYQFSTFDVVGKIAKYNGCWYEAKVEELRKLDKRLNQTKRA